jgi:hypothetical protein
VKTVAQQKMRWIFPPHFLFSITALGRLVLGLFLEVGRLTRPEGNTTGVVLGEWQFLMWWTAPAPGDESP